MCATIMIVMKGVTYPVARFKIKVQVEDISDDVPIILFHPPTDEIIEKVVLKSADKMLKKVSFPVDLNKFIGKMFAFKIEITTYNMTNFDEMYLLQT
ncbi:hypothetical protein Hanom_Chr01g00080181 [Helianthus anomalus]